VRKLFITLGYCAPNTPIPQAILDAALGDAADACDEALSELTGLGLLKEGPSIHPLLAEFARGLDADQNALKTFSEPLANLAIQANADEDQAGNYTLFTPLCRIYGLWLRMQKWQTSNLLENYGTALATISVI